MSLEIRPVSRATELEIAYGIVRELRPHLSLESFESLLDEAARTNGYTLELGWFEGRCVGAIGYRILTDLLHGRHLYVDDLVVHPELRSHGVGAQLLSHAEAVAQERGCTLLRLCTGLENEGGKRFYEREGWALRAVVFKKPMGS